MFGADMIAGSLGEEWMYRWRILGGIALRIIEIYHSLDIASISRRG